MRVVEKAQWTKLVGGCAIALTTAAACANLDGLAGGPSGSPEVPETGAETGPQPTSDSGSDAPFQSPSALNLSTRELSFDFDCSGATETVRTGEVVLTNPTGAAQDFEVSLDQSGIFALADRLDAGADGGTLSGRVEAGGTQRFIVVARTRPVGDVETAALRITSAGLDDTVTLTAATTGARFEVDPATLDFGFVRKDTTATAALYVRNAGTLPVSIAKYDKGSTNFTLEAMTTYPPSDVATAYKLSVGVRSGPAGEPFVEEFTPIFDRPICGAPPVIRLKAQRVASDIITSLATLELPDIPCAGTFTSTSSFTLSNYSNEKVTFTASLPEASRFDFEGGSVAGGEKVFNGVLAPAIGVVPGKVTVGVKALPPNGAFGDFTDTVSLNYKASAPTNPANAIVSLHTRSYGASLAWNANAIHFTNNNSKNVNLTNTGNASACLRYGYAQNETSFSVEAGDTISAGGTVGALVTFEANDHTTHNANLTVTTVACSANVSAVPLCKPVPNLPIDGKQ